MRTLYDGAVVGLVEVLVSVHFVPQSGCRHRVIASFRALLAAPPPPAAGPPVPPVGKNHQSLP